MSKKLKSDIMLLITAIIWGSAFVAQKAGTVLEPFTYNGIRMLIGGLVLIPVIFLFKKINKEDPDSVPKTELEKQAEKKTRAKPKNKAFSHTAPTTDMVNYVLR